MVSVRVPPQNLDAERGVLGSLLIMNEAIELIAPMLEPGQFYNNAHQIIYGRILDLWRAGCNGIDAVTLAEALGSQLDEVGGIPYLSVLLRTVPHAAHARYYANIVRHKFYCREVIYKTTTALDEAYVVEQLTGPTLLDITTKIADDLVKLGVESSDAADITVISAQHRRHEELAQGRVWITTGLRSLDEQLGGGFVPTQLIILAGRPGNGKSALASNIAVRTAWAGHRVHMATLEMSDVEMVERMLSQISGVDGLRIKRNELDSEERSKVADADNQLARLPITIDDQSESMAEIMARCQTEAANGTKLFVIDYLQIIDPRDRAENRERQVAEMTREFKLFAKRTKTSVLLLSQINRDVEKRSSRGETPVPKLADLRESGAIEQDGNVVMFTHMPNQFEKGKPEDEALIIVAKQRAGPTGAGLYRWSKTTTTFSDMPAGAFGV